ncbi:MAG: chemotaxis protein CheB, partial [Clostridiales bacterium]|nr:chemotaxis protein CheB [Clostridiales bacterium]
MIDVLIAARGTMQQMLMDFLHVEKGYNVLGATVDIGQVKALAKNGKSVIVFDYTAVEEAFYLSVAEFSNQHKLKLIVLCDSVKDGFYFLNHGAHDMCVRPKSNDFNDRKMFLAGLAMKINKVGKDDEVNPRALKNKLNAPIRNIIAIGSSTGGTECILQILKNMPENAPPILIVQHMPPVFTRLYSNRLNNECKITVWEAQDGDQLENGLALVAPGDKQMRLKSRGGKYYVSCTTEAPF